MKVTGNSLVRKLDRLWRRRVLERAKFKCEICGTPASETWIQASHITSRMVWFLRWLLKNGVGVCQGCHREKVIMAWLRKNDPRRYRWMIRMRNTIVQHKDINFEKIYRDLQVA